VVDAYPRTYQPKAITLRFAKSDALLGVSIPAAQQADYLRRLGLEITEPNTESTCTVAVPSFSRRFESGKSILIEEIARLYGVDQIPSARAERSAGRQPL